MHLPSNDVPDPYDGDPSNSVPNSQDPYCVDPMVPFCDEALMDKVIEHQVGGGPSPYCLHSNINLTPWAAEESRITAGLHHVHYNDGMAVDNTKALLSICINTNTESLLSMYDDCDDDDSDILASPCGRYSNTNLKILNDTFKACRDLLSEAANKVQRPFCSVIKQFQAANGHIVGKSEWNIFQIYFAANMQEVRDQVGDPSGDGKCSSLGTYQIFLMIY